MFLICLLNAVTHTEDAAVTLAGRSDQSTIVRRRSRVRNTISQNIVVAALLRPAQVTGEVCTWCPNPE